MAYRQQTTQVQDEMELETMAEMELTRLKRQYRIMENDRITYAEEARLQLRNQQKIIDRLEFEKAELALAIKASKSDSNTKKDQAMEAQLKCLLEKRTKYLEMIANEKQQIAELQEQIIKVSKEVQAMKKKVRTDAQMQEIVVKQNKSVSILENRLEVATKRFNLMVANNSKLRHEIDNLLKERAQFNELWNKLIGQLNTGKQVINDLIEQATIAFNQRDEELNKINALRERGARDLKSHTLEMCELQRTLDNEMKLQEFLGIKGQFRETSDLDDKLEADRQAKKQEMEEKVAAYTQILNAVKEFTGEDQIDKLAANFLKQEEENFALFSYVNELNEELESLQTRVEQLRIGINDAKALTAHRGETQAETLEKLKKELEEETKLANEAEKKLTEAQGEMEKLLKGIDSLFRALRCDNSSILQLLGDNSQVTMNNVMLYLGLIEKRITDMFNKVHWVDKATKADPRLDEDRLPLLKTPVLAVIAPTQPCPLCVEKEEFQNVSEGFEAPLTRTEAVEKLEERMENDISELLHNVSGCNLPAARKIMQRRYQ